MPQSSFYADGETYSTSTVTSNDTPGSATPSQAPSSFFQSGGIYTALAEESTTVSLFQQLLTSTQASQAAAAASASAAAASAASMPSASATNPLQAGTASPGTANAWSRGDHVHPTDTTRASVTYVDAQDALRAPLASPALTGTPTAPTAAGATSTTQIATTAFVMGQLATGTPAMDGTGAVGTSTNFARADHVHPTDTSRAPLASPALTGAPTAPTAAAGTNTTQLATTAFVATSFAPLASPPFTGTPTAPTPASQTDSTTKIATTAWVQGLVNQSFTNYTPTAVPTSGAFTTVSYLGGSYLVVGKLLYVAFDINLTTIGTGAGFIDITMPMTYSSIVICSAFELNNGAGMGTATTSGTTQIRLKLYNNGGTVAGNARWQGGCVLRLP